MNASTASPQAYARTGGVLYLITIAAGIFGELFALALWLIVRGVNLSKWHERQGAIAGV